MTELALAVLTRMKVSKSAVGVLLASALLLPASGSWAGIIIKYQGDMSVRSPTGFYRQTLDPGEQWCFSGDPVAKWRGVLGAEAVQSKEYPPVAVNHPRPVVLRREQRWHVEPNMENPGQCYRDEEVEQIRKDYLYKKSDQIIKMDRAAFDFYRPMSETNLKNVKNIHPSRPDIDMHLKIYLVGSDAVCHTEESTADFSAKKRKAALMDGDLPSIVLVLLGKQEIKVVPTSPVEHLYLVWYEAGDPEAAARNQCHTLERWWALSSG